MAGQAAGFAAVRAGGHKNKHERHACATPVASQSSITSRHLKAPCRARYLHLLKGFEFCLLDDRSNGRTMPA